ncbi:hypothetical protein [Bacillus mycoides]|uniref:Uncharacterized protein n=1 Tax=Bacillus mycoides TaxID=1405 RepID=A0ABC9QWQ4_BACMY|nr:hypothetical protein [Bacillus mycoides]EJR30035.1 hypothetical protein III_05804 [Bacillus mycoides]
MNLQANKFDTVYPSGIDSNAIYADDEKIKMYIIEHAQLMDMGICQGETGCQCEENGQIKYDEYQQYPDVSLMRVEFVNQVLSDEYITVVVKGLLYAVYKPFFVIIYDSNIDKLKHEIENSFDEFTGFVIIQCRSCGAWAVYDS